jgi:hypothetical protein
MQRHTDGVDDALAKLERVRDEQLASLADGRAAEALYQEVVSMPEPTVAPRRSAPSRRRRLLVRAAAAAAAVIAVAVVLSVANVFGDHGPGAVAPAGAIDKAAAALAPKEGVVLHVHMVGSQLAAQPAGGQGSGDAATATWSDESWWTTSKPIVGRMIEKSFGNSVETATTADGHAQLYDRKTDTIYDLAPQQAGQAGPTSAGDVDYFRTTVLKLLQSGQARVEGAVKVDGRDAIRIVSKDGHAAYMVDAATYDPIEWTTTGSDGGSDPAVTLRFPAYEQLPATQDNLKATSLTAAHPDAKVDTDPAPPLAAVR